MKKYQKFGLKNYKIGIIKIVGAFRQLNSYVYSDILLKLIFRVSYYFYIRNTKNKLFQNVAINVRVQWPTSSYYFGDVDFVIFFPNV